MVATFVFQPSLLDCWACRDLKRFRHVLKGGGGIPLTQNAAPFAPGSVGKDGATNAGSPSNSYGRSPGQTWGSVGNALTGSCPPAEVNRRDHLGRTTLHLLAASTEPASVDYLTALLAHPTVNVNLQDSENGWTPLHRALYHGNLQTALTLLRRSPPADVRVKDFEGLTPFDLYNSTVHGTNPPPNADGQVGELFMWGANRNSTLGIGSSDDRALPDRVNFRDSGNKESRNTSEAKPGQSYDRMQVKDVGMSKFATIVLTAERRCNIWACGIGNVGRIGRASQMQAYLEPLRDFDETAMAISVGPDHTCILTTSGDLLTFGFNKFQQLGYALEQGQGIVASSTKGSMGVASTTFGGAALANSDLDVQISPRRVGGPLKKEFILGVAAGKLHSAAFTSDALYTWGTNTGQLGYDRAATPIQVTPRKVSAITGNMTIKSVAVSDFATACLLETGDVFLLHNDAAFFVRFPQLLFSSQASVYRPRQARPKPAIQRIIAGPNNVFAAISDIGDLWQFAPEHPAEYSQTSGLSTAAKATIKPQLIWSVRKNKKIGAARDVAFGQGQDIILVTESGHVFVRSRKLEPAAATLLSAATAPSIAGATSASNAQISGGKGKSGWKMVPFLQRVIRVAMNESGGFAAIKSEAKIRSITARGRSLQADLVDALPHLKARGNASQDSVDIVGELLDGVVTKEEAEDADEQASTSGAEESDAEDEQKTNVRMARLIAEAARRWMLSTDEQHSFVDGDPAERLPLGCDMFVVASGRALPAHRCVISARLPGLSNLLADPPSKGAGGAPAGIVVRRKEGQYTTMTLPSSSFGTALLFLHYLYCDRLPPIWTASVSIQVDKLFEALKMSPTQIRTQLRQLADALHLDALMSCLDSSNAIMPAPRLRHNLTAFFCENVENASGERGQHDVLLRLADREVPCHSVFLRRSPFFATLLQPHWTTDRWKENMLEIDMSHVRWEIARNALMHLYTDGGEELFATADVDRSHDQFIDFVVEVLAFSNELLLDKFKLVCSAILRRRVQSTNVAAMMTNADLYHGLPLKDASMEYAARNLETLLESGLLDDLESRMVKDLSAYIRQKQDDRLHRTRMVAYIGRLISEHNDYYFDLDIPEPSLGIAAARVAKRQPRSSEYMLSPGFRATQPGRATAHPRQSSSPFASPALLAERGGVPAAGGTDGLMFSMDDDVDEVRLPVAISASADAPFTPWKSRRSTAGKAEDRASASPKPEQSPLDLRSIMAAEKSDKGVRSVIPVLPQAGAGALEQQRWTTVNAATKLSQKDRKKQQQQQQFSSPASQRVGEGTNFSAPSATPGASPWKSATETRPVWSNTTPTRTSMLSSNVNPAVRADLTPSKADSPGPALGPIFSPTRSRPVAPRRGTSAANANEVSNMGQSISSAGGGGASVWASSSTSYAAMGTSPNRRAETIPAWGSQSNSPMQGSPAFGPTLLASHPPGAARPVRPSLLSSERSAGPSASATTIATDRVTGSSADSPAQRQPPRSLMDIQAEEIRRLQIQQASQQRAPKSFAQLQEEDRLENQKRLVEERERKEFEAWFAEEQKRLKKEQQQQSKKVGSKANKTDESSSGQRNQPRQNQREKGKGKGRASLADGDEDPSKRRANRPSNGKPSKEQQGRKSDTDGGKPRAGAGDSAKASETSGPKDSK